MRVAVFFVVALAACGGEGKCELPPCDIPDHACRGDEDCFQTEFCNFQQNSCGTSELDHGVCDRRPARFESCEFDNGSALVCGCDGVFHENECAANQAGTDVAVDGNCALPPDAFSCGSQACLKGRHACFELERSNGPSSSFNCEQIPPSCQATPNCACVRGLIGCDECTEVNGELRLKCDFPEPVPDDMAVTSSAAAPRASTSASR